MLTTSTVRPVSTVPKKTGYHSTLNAIWSCTDVLDDFAAPGPSVVPAPSVPATAQAPKLPAAAAPEEDLDEEAFTRELAEGMEALMRELGGPAAASPSTSQPGKADPTRDAVFMEAWEQLLVEGMGGEQGKAAAEAGVGKEREREKVEDAFQKTIREGMERMRSAEDGLQADAQAGSQGGDSLAQLLASLGDMGEGGAGGQSEEELQEMLEGMMAQLMSKEILYEPLKELGEKVCATFCLV